MINYVTFWIGFCGVSGYITCNYDNNTTFHFCDDDQHCCDEVDCCYALPESAIIGISVGGIILLFAVAICIWVLVEKNKTKPRRMIRPRQNANIAAVAVPSAPGYHPPQNDISQYPPPPTYNQVFSQYPPGYFQPPAYSETISQPPAYGQATAGYSQAPYPPPPAFDSLPPKH